MQKNAMWFQNVALNWEKGYFLTRMLNLRFQNMKKYVKSTISWLSKKYSTKMLSSSNSNRLRRWKVLTYDLHWWLIVSFLFLMPSLFGKQAITTLYRFFLWIAVFLGNIVEQFSLAYSSCPQLQLVKKFIWFK